MNFEQICRQAPAALRPLLEARPGEIDQVGRSAAQVIVMPDRVLKIAPAGEDARREVRMLGWLDRRLPVPEVLFWQEQAGRSWLLMSRLPGEMACGPSWISRPNRLVPLLAQGLKALWEIDPGDCPGGFGLEERLLLVESQVKAGQVSMEDAQPETYGPGGFSGPEALLEWLKTHRPPMDRVFSHGDFCLPNLFLQKDRVSGYLDLGLCGPADRYQDIALCYRSLKNNAAGLYGGPGCPGLEPEALFDALGLTPDWEKVRYYILLDELM